MLYWLRADECDSKLLVTSMSALGCSESASRSGSTRMSLIVLDLFSCRFFSSRSEGSGLNELLRLTEWLGTLELVEIALTLDAPLELIRSASAISRSLLTGGTAHLSVEVPLT